MFDVIYATFFLLMIAEMVLFLFLNLPFPKAWKGGLFKSLSESPLTTKLFKIQLVLCLLIILFYVDLARTERMFLADKNKLKSRTNMGAGSSNIIQVTIP